MEVANKEVIEKKVYEEGKKEYASKGVGNAGLTLGIIGTALGAGALWGRGNGFGLGGGVSMPENVNINTNRESANFSAAGDGVVTPTAFQAWEKGCEEALALTNALWGLHVSSMQADYDHRQTDIAEKFALYQSQINGDFGLYKAQRDGFDALTAKQNQDAFGLYKTQRDGFDTLNGRISQLEKEVAVGAAIRPYQDKLIQCEIEKAFTAGINYTDRRTCRMITGELVLPSTPTVTGYPSYNPCSCNNSGSTPTA